MATQSSAERLTHSSADESPGTFFVAFSCFLLPPNMSSSIPSGVPLSHVPLGPPPPGVESNFVNPENRAIEYYLVGGIGAFLMLFFVSIRLYVRLTSRTAWWDDGKWATTFKAVELHR
jgi:hypothetical protein